MKIVENLSFFDRLEDEYIGEGWEESEVYKSFVHLLDVATNEELIKLLQYNNASVRAYSFLALAKNQYPEMKVLLEEHVNDTTGFHYQSGCLIGEEQINRFYIDILTPQMIDNNCFNLSTKEIKDIK